MIEKNSVSPTFRIEDGWLWIGDIPYPEAEVHCSDEAPLFDGAEFVGEPKSLFVVHSRRARFHFDNGWGLSIVWSSGSYSVNHFAFEKDCFIDASPNAEVGIIRPDGELFTLADGRAILPCIPPSGVEALLQVLPHVSRKQMIAEDLPDSVDWR